MLGSEHNESTGGNGGRPAGQRSLFTLFALGRIGRLVAALAGFVIIPNVMGPGRFAVYSFYCALAGLLVRLSDLGLSYAAARFILRCRAHSTARAARQVCLTALAWRVGAAMAAVSAVLGVALLLPQVFGHNPVLVAILLAIILTSSIREVVWRAVYGYGAYGQWTLYAFIEVAARTVLVTVLYLRWDMTGALVGMLVSVLCSLVGSAVFILRVWRRTPERSGTHTEQRTGLRELLWFGLPLSLSELVYGEASNVGVLLLSWIGGKESIAVAVFALAARAVPILSTLASSAGEALYPQLAHAVDTGTEAGLDRTVSSAIRLLLAVHVALCLMAQVFADAIARLLFPSFGEMVIPLRILSLSLLAAAFIEPLMQLAMARRLTLLAFLGSGLFFATYLGLMATGRFRTAAGVSVAYTASLLVSTGYFAAAVLATTRARIAWRPILVDCCWSAALLGAPLMLPGLWRYVSFSACVLVWCCIAYRRLIIASSSKRATHGEST